MNNKFLLITIMSLTAIPFTQITSDEENASILKQMQEYAEKKTDNNTQSPKSKTSKTKNKKNAKASTAKHSEAKGKSNINTPNAKNKDDNKTSDAKSKAKTTEAKKTTPTTKSVKTDSANIVAIDLPSVKVHNNSPKKAVVTSITIDYKLSDEKDKKSITSSAKIPISSKKGKTFNLQLKLPVSAHEKNISAEPLGISKIKVAATEIDISPAWTGLSDSNDTIAGSEKIFFTLDGSNWKLDEAAMLKSAKERNKPKYKKTTRSTAAKKHVVAALHKAPKKKKKHKKTAIGKGDAKTSTKKSGKGKN